MGSLVSLLIYGAIAAAVLGSLYAGVQGARHWIAAPFVQEQIEADQKVVNAANADAKSAQLERDHAKEDSAQCQAISEKQNQAISVWQKIAVDNQKAAQQAREKASRDATAAAPRLADLQAKAGAAPKLEACEVELGKARAVLVDQLRARRGLPATLPAAAPKAPEAAPGLAK